MNRREDSGTAVLGQVVQELCRAGAEAWARGDEARATSLFDAALRVIGPGDYVERCPDGDCDEAAG